MWLMPLVVALIGGLNPRVGLLKTDPKSYLVGWIVRFVVTYLIMVTYSYIFLPAWVGPFWGMSTFLVIAWTVNFAFTIILTCHASEKSKYTRKPDGDSAQDSNGLLSMAVLPLFLVVIVFRGCAGSAMWSAEEKYQLIGEVQSRQWKEDMEPVKDSHIRMGSMRQAGWFGNKVLGESKDVVGLGSRFRPGKYSIQRANDQLHWVSPLEFLKFRHWWSSGVTPGYIKVSAEDPLRRPELVLKNKEKDISMRYTPTAYFNDNLERHLYLNGYSDVKLEDVHFEVDDYGSPYFVVSLVVPTLHYSNDKVVGIAIVDPQTGEIQRYNPDEIPDWVDRVMPEHLASEYITNWGHYAKGWWNSWVTKDSVVEPTADDLRLVWGDDGQPFWFTGISSSSMSDDSMVGFMMVNSRTGEAKQYSLSGSTEKGVKEAIDREVSNYRGWHSTDPILYNIYGHLAWVAPVVTDEGIFKGVAVVRADTVEVAFSQTKSDALLKFQKLYAGSSGEISASSDAKLETRTFIVDRFESDPRAGQYVMYSKSVPAKVFLGSSAVSLEIPLTKEGDEVLVSYSDTANSAVTIITFDNLSLPIGK